MATANGAGAMDLAAREPMVGAAGADATASSCIEQYPAQVPFDVGNVPRPSKPPEPGMAPEPAPVPTVEPIIEECVTGGGSNCASEPFVSKEAALCIALARPHEGLESWSADFRFHAVGNGGQLEWRVIGSGERGTDGCVPASVIEVDGASGDVLSQMGTRLCPAPS
jgi:hypothetical protein